MFGIGTWELVLIMILLLVVVGPGKLPEVFSAIGRMVREFRVASQELSGSLYSAVEEQPAEETPETAATAVQSAADQDSENAPAAIGAPSEPVTYQSTAEETTAVVEPVETPSPPKIESPSPSPRTVTPEPTIVPPVVDAAAPEDTATVAVPPGAIRRRSKGVAVAQDETSADVSPEAESAPPLVKLPTRGPSSKEDSTAEATPSSDDGAEAVADAEPDTSLAERPTPEIEATSASADKAGAIRRRSKGVGVVRDEPTADVSSEAEPAPPLVKLPTRGPSSKEVSTAEATPSADDGAEAVADSEPAKPPAKRRAPKTTAATASVDGAEAIADSEPAKPPAKRRAPRLKRLLPLSMAPRQSPTPSRPSLLLSAVPKSKAASASVDGTQAVADSKPAKPPAKRRTSKSKAASASVDGTQAVADSEPAKPPAKRRTSKSKAASASVDGAEAVAASEPAKSPAKRRTAKSKAASASVDGVEATADSSRPGLLLSAGRPRALLRSNPFLYPLTEPTQAQSWPRKAPNLSAGEPGPRRVSQRATSLKLERSGRWLKKLFRRSQESTTSSRAKALS